MEQNEKGKQRCGWRSKQNADVSDAAFTAECNMCRWEHKG